MTPHQAMQQAREALQLAREYVKAAANRGYDGTNGALIRLEAKRRLDIIDAALSQPSEDAKPCRMRYVGGWNGHAPVSGWACETCGYSGTHDAHPGCRKPSEEARDAARYRWLRGRYMSISFVDETGDASVSLECEDNDVPSEPDGRRLDEAIDFHDAALQAKDGAR